MKPIGNEIKEIVSKPVFDTLGARVRHSTISDENHQQMFRRLSDPIFNSGAMHGTPGQKKGKSR